jgi:O-antigen/teichoic acid export membrane protein
MIKKINMTKNVIWLSADKVIRTMVALFISAAIARELGPSEYGLLAYALTIIAILQGLGTLGMDQIIIKKIAEDNSDKEKVIVNAILLRLIFGIILYALTILCFYNSIYENLFFYTGILLVFQCIDVIDLWCQGMNNARLMVMVRLFTLSIISIYRIHLLDNESTVEQYALSYSYEYILILCISYYIFYKYISKIIYKNININMCLNLLEQSWRYILSGIFISLYMKLDQILINHYLGSAELAKYSVVVPLVSYISYLPALINIILLPYFSKMRIENFNKYKILLNYTQKLLIITSICAYIFLYSLSNFLINILYGSQYIDSVEIMQIYAFTLIPIFLGVGQGLWAVTENKSKVILINSLAGLVSSLVLNLILIPLYGIKGAAISTVISYFISAILMNLITAPEFFKIQIGFTKWKH